MFRKPFTRRSEVSLRNTEKLVALLPLQLISLLIVEGKTLLSDLPTPIDGITTKSSISLVRVVCHDGSFASVFTFEKEPLLFYFPNNKILFPTVYLTRKAPETFPVLVINRLVFEKLQNGADLFLQGVIRPLRKTKEFGKHEPIAISVQTSSNEIWGPVAVGYSLISSMEMIASGMQGPGVRVVHFYADYLWLVLGAKMGSLTQPLTVTVNESSTIPTFTINKSFDKEFPPLGNLVLEDNESVSDSTEPWNKISEQEQQISVLISKEEQSDREAKSLNSVEILLKRCFLAALKYRVTKKKQLPLDIGEFYSCYLLPCVPSNQRIDLKKTEYKKFSTFIKSINEGKDGPVISLTASKKKSDMISKVNWEHPLLKNFKLTDERIHDIAADEKLIHIDEYLSVTELVLAIFQGYGKGDLVDKTQAREVIITYIKYKNPTRKGELIVPVDPILVSLLPSSAPLDWNTLIQIVLSKMTKTYKIIWTDGRQLIRKSRLPKIVFKIESRSGNKQVTLVNNLSVFGIDHKRFCQKIQAIVAAGACVVDSAIDCEGPQILVQGNQIFFISNILLKYGIEKKYMTGLELIPKKQQQLCC
ncbi:unnamed protein product [Thelazia callipaeda]|uniref:SUI1 domain-containing protein n=1 Tax=Thelazia callipaeda TaxID=103827 RepID=A0A0N5CK57_THECL|nr:unnamed protein product [Thelazia callipaeda]